VISALPRRAHAPRSRPAGARRYRDGSPEASSCDAGQAKNRAHPPKQIRGAARSKRLWGFVGGLIMLGPWRLSSSEVWLRRLVMGAYDESFRRNHRRVTPARPRPGRTNRLPSISSRDASCRLACEATIFGCLRVSVIGRCAREPDAAVSAPRTPRCARRAAKRSEMSGRVRSFSSSRMVRAITRSVLHPWATDGRGAAER